MESEDPLLELVIDAVDVDRQRIVDALRGVIAIDKGGTVIPTQGYQALNAQQKILAFLLGRKVAVLLDLAEQEAIAPKDLAASTGVPEGTVYPTVRKLHSDRMASQDVDSKYYLSLHQVGTAISALTTSTSQSDVAPGAKNVDAGGDRAEAKPSHSKPTKKRPQRSAAKKAKSNGAQSQVDDVDRSGRRRSAGSEFSPTTAVRDLIDSGFFEEPKGLADVRQRLKDKQGRDVPVTTLSSVFTRLLRERALDRTRNSEGVYEYVNVQAP